MAHKPMQKIKASVTCTLLTAITILAGCGKSNEPEKTAATTLSTTPFSAPTARPLYVWEIMEDAVIKKTEMGAVDCGQVEAKGPQRVKADACTVTAFQQRKPFRMRYTIRHKDGTINKALVGTSKGQVYFLSNQEHCCEDRLRWSSEQLCKNPVVVAVKGKKHLACHDQDSSNKQGRIQ